MLRKFTWFLPSLDGRPYHGRVRRKVEPGIAVRMKQAGVQATLVSPIQVDKFRNEETFINELIDCGIRIMMLPHAEEWDRSSRNPNARHPPLVFTLR
jgi:hypothetical protein